MVLIKQYTLGTVYDLPLDMYSRGRHMKIIELKCNPQSLLKSKSDWITNNKISRKFLKIWKTKPETTTHHPFSDILTLIYFLQGYHEKEMEQYFFPWTWRQLWCLKFLPNHFSLVWVCPYFLTSKWHKQALKYLQCQICSFPGPRYDYWQLVPEDPRVYHSQEPACTFTYPHKHTLTSHN